MAVVLINIIAILLGMTLCISSTDFDNAYQKASAEFKKYFEDQWLKQTLKYEGPDLKIKLVISDKAFLTSTHVLFNAKHGVTLFIHEFLGTDQNSINYECTANDNDKEFKSDDTGTLFKFDEAVKDKMDKISQKKENKIIELYFDRDPEYFIHILSFMRGYPMKSQLYELNVRRLERLLADAQYFKVAEFEQLVQETLHSRFNAYLCASPSIMQITDGGVGLKKITQGNHYSCSVYGVLYTGRRYVEFEIITHGNRYQMIGVQEAKQFHAGVHPGWKFIKGIALYGANGHLYRNGGNEGWSDSFHFGDKVGVLVDISEDKRDAKITWYINGKKIKQAKDLTQYMIIDNGVVFSVSMHDINEEVRITQYPEMPKT